MKKNVFTVREDNDVALSFGVSSIERRDQLNEQMENIVNEEEEKGENEELGCRVIDRIANEVGENDQETHYAVFSVGNWFADKKREMEGSMNIGNLLGIN